MAYITLSKIFAKSIHLVHSFVQNGHNTNFAAAESSPVDEVMFVAKYESVDAELRRYGTSDHTPCVDHIRCLK